MAARKIEGKWVGTLFLFSIALCTDIPSAIPCEGALFMSVGVIISGSPLNIVVQFRR
jgi:hypothetical protein